MTRAPQRNPLKFSAPLALLFAPLGCTVHRSAPASPPPSTAIVHVTVVDPATERISRDSTVLIRGRHIIRIGSSLRVHPPAGATIIDGSGRYLIPGLWNMHLHAGNYAKARSALPTLLSQGVTGVRDMGAPPADIVRLRDEIELGALAGPRLVVAGPLVQGYLPFDSPMMTKIDRPFGANSAITRLKRARVDFIKIHDAIPEAVYRAVAAAARGEHIPFAGHVPPTVRAEDASDLGQASIEHLGGRFFGLLVAASNDGARLHRETSRFYAASIAALERGEEPPFASLTAAFTRPLLESYDPIRAAALYRRFVRNRTWQCPTLVALPRIWEEYSGRLSAEDRLYAGRVVARSLQMTAAMQAAGVGILAGTDGDYASGGTALHAELEKLVQSGLTPMQALQAATVNPARFLVRRDLGRLAAGRVADLVLLAGDPIADIRNTRRVHLVFASGRMVWRGEAE